MKQEIFCRSRNSCGHIERKLRCGHTHVEPHGSKAKHAKFAMCKECDKLLINILPKLHKALKYVPNFES